MHVPTIFLTFLLAVLSSPFLASCDQVPGQPCLSHLFSGKINIVPPAGDPIAIPGGVRVLTPITSGTISGPAINATITSGLAFPSQTNQTFDNDVEILLYGKTDDGVPLLLRESGVGPAVGQVTRIVLEIGGRYKDLTEKFILATVTPNKERTSVAVEGFEVVKDCGTHTGNKTTNGGTSTNRGVKMLMGNGRLWIGTIAMTLAYIMV